MFFYYDEAVINKIKPKFQNICYARTEEAMEKAAQMNQGKVPMPLITFYSESITFNKELYNMARHKIGQRFKFNDNNSMTNLMDIAFRISYNMDIWAVKKETVDVLSSEIFFFLIDNPTFSIQPPMLENPYNFNLQIEDFNGNWEAVDTGEYGRAYRYTLSFTFPEARIWRVKTEKTALIIPLGLKE